MVVTGTGMNTEMGKIANALTTAKEEQTPLQVEAEPAEQNPLVPGHLASAR